MDNNIIQWNCRGLRANFTDLRLLCDKYNPIVCCLQETMLTKDDFIIRGFNCIVCLFCGFVPCRKLELLAF